MLAVVVADRVLFGHPLYVPTPHYPLLIEYDQSRIAELLLLRAQFLEHPVLRTLVRNVSVGSYWTESVLSMVYAFVLCIFSRLICFFFFFFFFLVLPGAVRHSVQCCFLAGCTGLLSGIHPASCAVGPVALSALSSAERHLYQDDVSASCHCQ